LAGGDRDGKERGMHAWMWSLKDEESIAEKEDLGDELDRCEYLRHYSLAI
jgi:hypothetical protein